MPSDLDWLQHTSTRRRVHSRCGPKCSCSGATVHTTSVMASMVSSYCTYQHDYPGSATNMQSGRALEICNSHPRGHVPVLTKIFLMG
jgi:hypothetical protein